MRRVVVIKNPEFVRGLKYRVARHGLWYPEFPVYPPVVAHTHRLRHRPATADRGSGRRIRISEREHEKTA